ncbi:MAG: hypothetical protein ABIH39_06700, partial [Candidatus Margulisiibacteriota bacterium]
MNSKIFYLRLFLSIFIVTSLSYIGWAAPITRIAETGAEFETIQAALTSANACEHIYVYPGTHTGVGNVALVWPNVQDITLMASPNAGTSANVILDAQNLNRHILQNYAVRWALDNLLFTNGTANYTAQGGNNGGSICININNSNHILTINSCIIKYSRADYGGGLYISGSSKTRIFNSVIQNNMARHGGGFYGGTNTLEKCIISVNEARLVNSTQYSSPASGGGFYGGGNTLINCIIQNNTATVGGGFYNSTTRLTCCKVQNNRAYYQGGGFCNGNNTLINCTVQNNVSDGNVAAYGGAFSYGTNTLIGSVMVANRSDCGGAFYNGTNKLTNCTLAKNSPEIFYSGSATAYNSIFEGEYGNSSSHIYNSAFTDTSLPGGIYNQVGGFSASAFINYANNDLRLSAANYNAAINTGANAYWSANAANITSDIDGNPRIFYNNIDLGAYEYQQVIDLPRSPPKGFSVFNADNKAILIWENPINNSFAGVVIRRSTDSYPETINDGTQIYSGNADIIVDTAVTNNTRYYYSIWSKDTSGYYSVPVTGSVYLSPGNIISSRFADDFEDGDLLSHTGGSWYTYDDRPAGGVSTITSNLINPGADNSLKAINVSYQTHNLADKPVYAALGVNTGVSGNGTINVSGNAVFEFYIKGDGHSLNIELVADPDPTAYNNFRYIIDSTPLEWTRYIIKLNDLTQETGWGTAAPIAAVLQNLQAIHFKTKTKAEAGTFQIDDVHLYDGTVSVLNSPPEAPALVSPASGAVGVTLSPTLKWSGGDSDSDSLTYNIYLSTNANAPDIIASVKDVTPYTIPWKLAEGTTYYWKIEAIDTSWAKTESVTRSFTTWANSPPGQPVLVNPASGEQNVPMPVTFKWNAGTDPDGDLLNYSIYVSTNVNGLAIIGTTQNAAEHTINWQYEAGITYNWMVVAADPRGERATSDVWAFKTLDIIVTPNTPPTANAGPDKQSFVGQAVTLDASQSDTL